MWVANGSKVMYSTNDFPLLYVCVVRVCASGVVCSVFISAFACLYSFLCIPLHAVCVCVCVCVGQVEGNSAQSRGSFDKRTVTLCGTSWPTWKTSTENSPLKSKWPAFKITGSTAMKFPNLHTHTPTPARLTHTCYFLTFPSFTSCMLSVNISRKQQQWIHEPHELHL